MATSWALARPPLDAALLARWQVSLMAGAATMFGYCLAAPQSFSAGIPAALGSFFLCAGCSTLNQLQEADIDARMHRTRNRPIPTGRIARGSAMFLALLFLLGSLALYGIYGRPSLLVLHLAVIVIYNLAYTPLKRITPLALLLGAIPGSLPPLVGWYAAGGPQGTPMILAVTGLFYLWQIPHFWLLAHAFREDLVRAGLPTPPPMEERRSLAWLLSLWLAAMASLALSFPALSLVESVLLKWGLVAIIPALVYASVRHAGRPIPAFNLVNLFMLAFMGMLLADAFVSI